MLRIRTRVRRAGTLTIDITNGHTCFQLTLDETEIQQAHQPLRLLKNKLDELDQKGIDIQTNKGNRD